MKEPIYHYDLVQNSEEWFKARLGIITSSEMSKLITPTGKIANNEDSRMIVYEKVGERISNRVEERFHNFHTERGNVFEPFARDLYSKERKQVNECGFITREFDGFTIGYSPDGLVDEDGLVEIMCRSQANHVKDICEQAEPKTKIMQIHTGLLVTGRKYCDYIGHFNGMYQRILRIEPDLDIHELILAAAKNLEECIEKNIELYNENSNGMPKAKYERGIS